MSFLLLALGGVAGALCRYHGARLVQARTASAFPLGTWLINLSGSLLLGLLVGLLSHAPSRLPTEISLLLGTGFCGAYTTFSAFAFETIQLWRQGRYGQALINLVGQPICGVCAAWLGLSLGSS
jgi:CrcB protein